MERRPEPLPDPIPWVRPVTLTGRIVRLEPLERGHLEGLVAAAADPATWTWLFAPLTEPAAVEGWLEAALRARQAGTELPFATLDAATGRLIGSTRYLAIAPEHRRLEIGWTWLHPSAWRTGANVEAKLLLLQEAFDSLGAMRVEWKTDARNERSRAALEGIGARFEGVFRRHMRMADGRVRDSAWYAVTDEEWPAVRDALRARLASHEGPR